ncbi:flavodoxin family protein [Desulfovibrio sp. OttesenSCG-928-C14]|nr:flavodoxin family protein [Desulfovibrio sp. OttesenSCG-928-C14]
MAKVLIVKSSHRKGSNSSLLAGKVAEGARAAGHEVQVVDISRMRIEPCRGCDACRKGGKGCVVQDEMQPLYPLVREAEVIIYASPIYWFNMCGQLKQFIDRCYAVAAGAEPGAPSPFASKKLGAVLAFGDDDPYLSGGVNALRSFQDTAAYCGADWAGAVYGAAYDENELAGNAALLEQAFEYGKKL